MPTPPDPAALYPEVAARGSLAAALRAEAGSRLAAVPVTSPDSAPLLHATAAGAPPHREPLRISASSRQRQWSIRGTEPHQGLALVDGGTDDLSEVARAVRAWCDGTALQDIRRAAPFVHLTGRFEVPDNDPALLTESEWQGLRRQAAELEYAWQETHQNLIEAAHAEPAAPRPLPVHEPLGPALLDDPPPGPHRRRTVPGREQRRHVRGGHGHHQRRPRPIHHGTGSRGNSSTPPTPDLGPTTLGR